MISVIMLTYNRETQVARAIESILSQTYRDFEFIIVDNGSTDKSGRIAEEYASKDARIQVIHRDKGNIGAGRNTGIDVAQGEYITFVDDDDYAEPNYLGYLYGLAMDYSADIAVCGSWREIDGVQLAKYVFDEVFVYNGESAVVELLKREKFNSANPTKLISAHIFKDVHYSDYGKYDDIKTIYKQFSSAQSVVVSGVPLYTFVRHAQNNSLGTVQGEIVPPGQIEEYLATFRERTRWLTDRFPGHANYWLYTEISYALSMYDKIDDEVMSGRLEGLLRSNLQAFRDAAKYYTQRDKMLLQKYRRRFCV